MKSNTLRVQRNQQSRRPNNQERTKHISAAENRFGRAMFKIRSMRKTVNFSRAEEVNIAHIIHKIQTYGFGFFPNHFVMDDIIELEGVIKNISKRQVEVA